MINLFKSKLRKDLLKLYFARPEKEYYLRELERLLKRPVAYIRRELMALEKTGLFASDVKGKQKYFRLNTKYPLYEEMKTIVSKTIGIEKSLKDILQQVEKVEVAFIFGSFAKGEEDVLSDIDLMIVGTPDEDVLIEKISNLESKIDREINYYVYSSKDLEAKIKQEDPFVEEVLSSEKIFLIGSPDDIPGLS